MLKKDFSTVLTASLGLAVGQAAALLEMDPKDPSRLRTVKVVASLMKAATTAWGDASDQSDDALAFAEHAETMAVLAVRALGDYCTGGNGIDIADVSARVKVGHSLIDVLDCIIDSSLLPGPGVELLSDLMHSELTPLLRLGVHLCDPDKHDGTYVPDAFVQEGWSMMGLAARLSRTIERADRKARESAIATLKIVN